MNYQVLADKAKELLNELNQLGHGEQCETLNYSNSAPCDCRLTEAKLLASEVVSELLELLGDHIE